MRWDKMRCVFNHNISRKLHMTTNRTHYDHDIYSLPSSTPARPQCLCWTSIVMIFLMMCVLVALCQYTANRWKKQDPQVHSNTARYALVVRAIYERERITSSLHTTSLLLTPLYSFFIDPQIFSIIMIILAGLFLCAAVFLRRSINLAIKAIALAAT